MPPNWIFFLVVLILCLAAQSVPQGDIILAYDRQAIVERDQVWRLLSGYFRHTNPWHLALNLGGLLLVLAFRPHHEPRWRVPLELLGVMLLGSLLVLALYPNIAWFVGLSGALHGLLLLSLLAGWHESPRVHAAALGLLLAKVGYEQWGGGNDMTAALIEARVLVEGHLCGTLAAILLAPLLLVKRQRSRR